MSEGKEEKGDGEEEGGFGLTSSELDAWKVEFAAAPKERKDEESDRILAIRRAADFYYNNKRFEKTLQRWAEEYCGEFEEQEDDSGDGSGEYTLRHYELYDEFRKLLETHLEDFVANELRMDTSEFFALVAGDEHEKDPFSGSSLVALINSAAAFPSFYQMMLDAKLGVISWGMPPLMDQETGEVYI